MKKTAYCFDLEGTITQQELMPLIAGHLGLYPEIETLTEATLKGLIPYENTFKLYVTLLKSTPISTIQNIVKQARLQPRLLSFLSKNASHCYILTENLDVWIQPLIEKIGLPCLSSKASFQGDSLSGIQYFLNKGEAIDHIRNTHDYIIAIGDGMNDTSMFEKSDLCISYGGINPPVDSLIKLSHYLVYHEDALCRLLTTL